MDLEDAYDTTSYFCFATFVSFGSGNNTAPVANISFDFEANISFGVDAKSPFDFEANIAHGSDDVPLLVTKIKKQKRVK